MLFLLPAPSLMWGKASKNPKNAEANSTCRQKSKASIFESQMKLYTIAMNWHKRAFDVCSIRH
jgi:hypothetical protein